MTSSTALVLALAAVLQTASSQDSLLDAVPCQSCQKVSLKHYEAMDCQPNFDSAISDCCPASFTCRSEEERGIALDTCVYNNNTYKVADKIPVDEVCSIDCSCREGFPEGNPARVECVHVECPSLFNPIKPGCRNLHDINKCCEVGEECTDILPGVTEPAVTRDDFKCVSEGKEYQLGQRLEFDNESCQVCVCTQNFTDAFGPGCKTVNCQMEYRGREELLKGCTPLYFGGGCCNIDWICPDSAKVKPTPKQLETTEGASATTHCTLGKIVAARSEVLETDDCNINCICATPPAFTCVQYENCDKAKKAQESGVLP